MELLLGAVVCSVVRGMCGILMRRLTWLSSGFESCVAQCVTVLGAYW